jgi:hypothetical protein
MNLTKETIDRKVMFAENKLRKDQIDDIRKAIDDIEWNRDLDNDYKATIKLMALKKLEKRQLASWRQFRTKNGLSNDALVGA